MRQLRRLDDDFGRQIRAVIEEIVFFICRVPRGFNRQLAVDTLLVQRNRLVDDILVAAFEPQMLESEAILQIYRQFVTGNAVGHHCRTRMLDRDQRGRHGNDGIAADFPAIFINRR